MHENILRRKNLTTTVRGDVRVIEKLDTTLDGLTANKRNTDSTEIFEGASESLDVKKLQRINKFDFSGRVNFANSIPVQTPDLVPMRNPPVQTYNVTDGGTAGVTTRIADTDGIWRAGPGDIRDAALHDSDKDSAAKLAYRKFLNDLDLETIHMLERDKRARENVEINLT